MNKKEKEPEWERLKTKRILSITVIILRFFKRRIGIEVKCFVC